jgi:hypothetical protein
MMMTQARVQSKPDDNKVKANIAMTPNGENVHLPHKKIKHERYVSRPAQNPQKNMHG